MASARSLIRSDPEVDDELPPDSAAIILATSAFLRLP